MKKSNPPVPTNGVTFQSLEEAEVYMRDNQEWIDKTGADLLAECEGAEYVDIWLNSDFPSCITAYNQYDEAIGHAYLLQPAQLRRNP